MRIFEENILHRIYFDIPGILIVHRASL